MVFKNVDGHIEALYLPHEQSESMMWLPQLILASEHSIDLWSQVRGSVTLLSHDALQAANHEAGTDVTENETKRNIITKGIDLDMLVGVHFSIGDVALQGTDIAHSVERPSHAQNSRNFYNAFSDRGGLHARILNGGTVQIGDPVRIPGLAG